MRKSIQSLGLGASIWIAGALPGFAAYGPDGGGAPSPEIGATALGLLLACGLAFYVFRRRQQ
jgi:LPXTG-motif cell wall-anchored protein